MSKLTTEQVDEMAELREAGWSYARLSERYSVSAGAIHYRCLRVGAKSPRSQGARRDLVGGYGKGFGGITRRFSVAEDNKLLELARAGVKVAEIARKIERAPTSVRIRLLTLELADTAE